MSNPLYDQLFGVHAGRQAPFLWQPDVQAISYDAFLRRTAQLAHALVACGLSPGDRLAAPDSRRLSNTKPPNGAAVPNGACSCSSSST